MDDVTPDPILQALGAHLASKYLFVAADMGVFEALAAGALPLDELAKRLGLAPRTARILVDALVATGWLARQDDCYANTPVTAAFLGGTSGAPDLRPMLRLWEQVVYPQWATLADALRQDRATYSYAELDAVQRSIFSEGVAVLTAPSAHALASTYDFGRHRRVLDLGGGTGSFLTALLHWYPHMQAALFETPATAALARQNLRSLASAVDIIEGDLRTGTVPPGYDAFIVANVLHLFAPAFNQLLLERIRAAAAAAAAAAPAARVLLVDFWTDSTRTAPVFAALMAGEFQIVTGQGDVYSVEDAQTWLTASGWRFVEHRALAGAASLIVAEAP